MRVEEIDLEVGAVFNYANDAYADEKSYAGTYCIVDIRLPGPQDFYLNPYSLRIGTIMVTHAQGSGFEGFKADYGKSYILEKITYDDYDDEAVVEEREVIVI